MFDWLVVKDGDARARSIFDRHYSRYTYADGRKPKLFVGPGEKMVLLTPTCDALFVWRKFVSLDKRQTGVNCAVFRNEGTKKSSCLIKSACDVAWSRWPGERLYTYVNQNKIKSNNPGFCFLMAGWVKCGYSQNGLLILEKGMEA